MMERSTGDALAAIWLEHRPAMLERLNLIESAVSALLAGELDDALLHNARAAAHTLIGSVGTLGFVRASQAARELELELDTPSAQRAQSISALLQVLRRELQSGSPPSDQSRSDEPIAEPVHVLLLHEDRQYRADLAAEAASLGIGCDTAATPEQARTHRLTKPPSIVLLDLTFPPETMEEVYRLLSELTSGPSPVPVLVLADGDTFTDRVEAARRGGRAFLSNALSPAEALDAAQRALERDRLQATRVLLVDDDPAMLDAMRVLLERHRIEVSTLADPARFWETLEEVAPELLILDVDMPGVNGAELCRVVRNDPRWNQIAVIFVTARTDSATVEALFRAGADDYVTKPIVEPELMTRVTNRLERVRLHRALAETDSLTGLANRSKSSVGMAQLLSLAARYSQPLSIAMLDLDHFKAVNDTHGHAVGDSVLRGLGERLRLDFRGEDVVGRWGGEEFIVAMYGMTREDGVRRLRDTLQRFALKQFTAQQSSFRVSFSAGVAEYPRDGHDLDQVIQFADEALYEAKAAGRSQVLAGGRRSGADEPQASSGEERERR